MDEVAALVERQDGVITRGQALGLGLSPTAVARMLRRREWHAVHPGVYVEHSGPLTWRQRAWAAVLACWPAALAGESALRADDGPGRRGGADRCIVVAVDRDRHLTAPAGVRLRRVTRLDQQVRWNLGPPRQRYEDAVLDLAAGARSDLRAVAVLADAVGGRRTTAERLLNAVAERPRVARRGWLHAVLLDVESGTSSVLEHGYLDRVERRHGLPRAARQVVARGPAGGAFGVVATRLRDVEHTDLGLVVELDGRLFHGSAAVWDADLERDLDAAVDSAETIRLGWGQVFDRPCRTAAKVALVLQRRGWDGEPTSCPDCGGSHQPG